MPFRSTFDCLWCGRPWQATSEADLGGWASLCPDCLERAPENSFLRFRLRTALRERSAGATGGAVPATDTVAHDAPAPVPGSVPGDDDWYLRRGRYSRGPARDLAWHAELDAATTWLDRLPLAGEVVELAAGAGWWSPLLAGKGDLSIYDPSPERLDRARERLVAHRLRAHIHVRDAWAEPERQVDGVFCGFWLGRLQEDRLGAFLGLVARWLRPGGRFGFIDSLPDPETGPVGEEPADTVDRPPEAYAAAMGQAGFELADVTGTGRFFVMGSAVRSV